MRTIKYLSILSLLLGVTFSQTSVITIGGTGTAATSAHITVTTDGYKCPDEYVVESGASLTTWDPSAICQATTSGAGDIALPVELTNFTAEQVGSAVLIKWTTESEIDNIGFMLDRRTEVSDWNEIASYKTDDRLLGQGTTSIPTMYECDDNYIVPNKTYEYRLSDVDHNGIVAYHATRTVTIADIPVEPTIEKFTVLPAYPNPFNPSTTIKYGLDKDSHVVVEIYDISGKLIATLVNAEQSLGWYSVVWNGTNSQNTQVPAGLYLSRIIAGNEVKTFKIMLLK